MAPSTSRGSPPGLTEIHSVKPVLTPDHWRKGAQSTMPDNGLTSASGT